VTSYGLGITTVACSCALGLDAAPPNADAGLSSTKAIGIAIVADDTTSVHP
jgi:hypothetical protein